MRAGTPRILFAAPASGAGKTTLTIGFLRALLDRGVRPTAFKCGPDFIDPLFHREVLGVTGGNLDLFFTPPDVTRGLLRNGADGCDVAVLEGVMGYYDGIGMTDGASSWRLALETATPAVLVVRPGGAALSVAALVKGFLDFRENSMVRGVVLNGCRETYYAKLRNVLEAETGVRVLGYLPELPGARLESRHLGLVTPDAVAALGDRIAGLAARLRETVDIDGLLDLASAAPPLARGQTIVRRAEERAPVRIAVARDAAFCFYYRENLDLLRECGAELVFFSPLEDAAPPAGIGGLYLGGGYPELHAARLAANVGMVRAVRDAVRGGLPTVAECGGFLYLQESIADGEGARHAMAGVLPGGSANAGRLGRFGYVTLTAERDCLLCGRGESIAAHEFHYWDSDACGDACVARKPDGASWPSVHAGPTLFAGFPHLYFPNNPAFAERFVAACRRGG